MNSVESIVEWLELKANPEKVVLKKNKFGVSAHNAMGVMMSDLNLIARDIGKNKQLAVELFDTDIYEARLLCAKVFPPKLLTKDLAEDWARSFENWEICDTFSMGVFAKSPLAEELIIDFTSASEEFKKRSGFATIAAYCMANKTANNDTFRPFFKIIIDNSVDERIYVKKAVNWALRSIGKRNIDLKREAILTAQEILNFSEASAAWIANDAIRELESSAVKMLDYPRDVYRK